MMKNPREILLARHGQVMPKLNALRERVLQATLAVDSAASPSPSEVKAVVIADWLRQFWQQLFWQPRRAWLSLASAWGFIALVNLGLSDSAPRPASQASAEAPTLMAWQAHQRYLVELILLTDTAAPNREPVPPPPQPRSQGLREWKGLLDQAGNPAGYATERGYV